MTAEPDFVVDRMLNRSCLQALDLAGDERVLDVGCGEGTFTAALAAAVGSVVAFDRDAAALQRARARHPHGIDWRLGDAFAPPLASAEQGTFDLVVARFVLESLPEPQAAVATMLRAARPGGRIALIDDDHDPLVVWPTVAGLDELWAHYCDAFDAEGGDARVGRRLVELLHQAGAVPERATSLPLGGCAGEPDFPGLVARIAAVLESKADRLLARGVDLDTAAATLARLRTWSERADATIWHHIRMAVGRRPPAAP